MRESFSNVVKIVASKATNRIRLFFLLFSLLFFIVLNIQSLAFAVDSDGFVFPVLGTSQTNPKNNIKSPLTDGWTGNGLGWSGSDLYGHLGQDYYRNTGCGSSGTVDNTAGQPVYAASNGEVVQVANNPGNAYGWSDDDDHGWGRIIVIKHTLSSGFITDSAMKTSKPNETNPKVVYTLYGHLKKGSITVTVGDAVTKGQKIAEIGDGGVDVADWDCSHLHFEIKNGGAYGSSANYETCCAGEGNSKSGVGRGYSGADESAPNRYIPSIFILNNLNKALIKPSDGTAVYWLQNKKMYHVINADIINIMQAAELDGWKLTEIATVTSIANYTKGPDFISTNSTSNGLLVKVKESPHIYLIKDGKKEHIPSPEEFNRRGYDWKDVIEVAQAILDIFPLAQDTTYEVGQDAPSETIRQQFISIYNMNSAVLGLATGTVKNAESSLSLNDGYYQTFTYGSIQYIAQGPYAGQVFIVHGSLYGKWGKMGFASSSLGFPTGNRLSTTSIYGTSGEYQTFEGGSIQLNSSEPFAVYGKVYEKWGLLGYASSALGLPVGDRIDAQSGFGTSGYYQRFEGGSVQVIGNNVYAVYGAIYRAWGKYGYAGIFIPGDDIDSAQTAWVGFPASDAYNWSAKQRQDFEGGYIESDGISAQFISTTHPTNLTASVQVNNSVLLNWQNHTTLASGINVYRSGSPTERIAELGPNTTTYTDSNAETGHPYTYFVQAFNDTAESPSSNQVIMNWGLYDGPWPMFRHDIRHTGQSQYSEKAFGVLKWKYLTESYVNSSPSIGSDGTVYVGASYYLYALNPDGTLQWKYLTGGSVYSSPAIGSDGTVYVGSWEDHLYALNPDGTLKWKYLTSDFMISSPSIGKDGTIYFGSHHTTPNHGYLHALNPDGTLKWKYYFSSHIYSSPSIGSDNSIYVGCTDWNLYALNPDGTLKWKYKTGGLISSSPAIGSDGTIYIGAWSDYHDEYLYALNPDGTLKWKYLTNDIEKSSPAVGSDGTVYVATFGGYLYALNPDGTLKWKYLTGNTISSSPAVGSDGSVYVGSNDRILYALNPDGTLKWKYPTGDAVSSSPAIGSDGTVYVGSWDDYLYAFNIGNKGTVIGYIYDLASGLPIPSVNITSMSSISAQTNVAGYYSLGAQNPGIYDITFSKTGYQPITIPNVVVTSGEAITLNVKMTAPGPLNIVLTSLFPAEVGVLYNDRVRISGGTWPYTFSKVYGALPAGLTLDIAYGNISGTPTTVGSYTFGIGVTDSLSAYAEREFTIVVTQPLTITTPSPLLRCTRTMSYSQSIQATGGSQPYTFTNMTHSYELNTQSANWSTAKAQCESKGGHLVVITSASENSIVTAWARGGGQSTWIGFSDISVEGSWQWVTGVPVTYTNWKSGEPSNSGGNEDCAHMWPSYSYQWNDGNCSNSYYYICEYEGIPPGIIFDTNGSLSGIPIASGTYQFIAKVVDASGRTDEKNFTLYVDDPLVITTTRLNDGIVGSAFNQSLTASGGYGTYNWAVFAGSLPAGLVLNSNGAITGTPTEATYVTLTISDSDQAGRITYKNFTIQVVNPLQILTASLPDGLINEPYSEAVRTVGGVSPFTFSYTGQLPAGLSLNTSTGIISGTPPIGGITNVSITVTDSTYPIKQTVTKTLGIRITSQLTITTSAVLPNTRKGVAINPVILVAKGGPSPFTWEKIDGYFPPGISLNSGTGELSGIPADKGDYVFTIKVTDSNSSSAQKQFFLHVSDILSIVTGAIPDGGKSVPYCFTLEGKGGFLPYKWLLKSGTLPTGLSLNTNTGAICGTPTTKQTFSFTIELNDSDSPAQKAEKSYIMEVLDELYIYTKTVPNGRVTHAYTAEVKAALGTPPYSWRLASGVLPPGLNLTSSPTIATIQGTPTTPGTYIFTLEVHDNGTPVKYATRQYTVMVYADLSIQTTGLKTAIREVPYSDSIVVTGDLLPYTFVIKQGGSLPTGLSLNYTTGAISGTTYLPTGHSSVFTIRVTDAGNPSDAYEKEFSIFVVDPLEIITTDIQGAQQNSYYQTSIEGHGGISPYHWSISAGALPTGLTINPDTGIISGTPLVCGNFSFTVKLQDSAPVQNDAYHSYNLNVRCPGYTLNVSTEGYGSGLVTSADGGLHCSYPHCDDGTCPPNYCAKGYSQGTTVTLTAKPCDTYCVFGVWSGACTGNTETCTLTMGSDKNVTAKFDLSVPGLVLLPRTGQTKCYDTLGNQIPCLGTGQDGEIQAGVAWPKPRFTVSYCNANGPCAVQSSDCDGDASTDVIKDNLTGLMWTRSGNLASGTKTWLQALDLVNNANVCGYTDWHLPNVIEIGSLKNAGEPDTAAWLVAQGFVDVLSGYWSSTTFSNLISYAWFVSMEYPDIIFSDGKNYNGHFAWHVRGESSFPAHLWATGQKTSYATGDDGDLERGAVWPTSRFTDKGDGTVVDNLTGLIWIKDANCIKTKYPSFDSDVYSGDGAVTWQHALDFVEGINNGSYANCAAGQNDWRLPNRKELIGLIDYSKFNPALPSNPFLNVQTNLTSYWSSTTINDSYAQAIDMMNGSEQGLVKSNSHSFVWPVRAGITEFAGDMNGDKNIDISDVILDLRCALGLDFCDNPCADINNDGVVDISDVILTLRMALGLDPLMLCAG